MCLSLLLAYDVTIFGDVGEQFHVYMILNSLTDLPTTQSAVTAARQDKENILQNIHREDRKHFPTG